ncbi:MAG: glycosyltransferase family 2 protein [Solidesulfovibrio sp. DCME]|uniref:glycosyltransferase family 2 protein n=1 Tax=Solidesulfovibrio sp. DCME TaxID=3447380 RepID=UPI003D0EDC17
MPTLDVTFVLPCLDEAKALPVALAMAREALTRLEAKGFSGEILVSDNGSTDGSPLIAAGLGCRVVHCPDKGYGNALRYGIEAANGQYIVMGDADGSYDFREAAPMIDKLAQGYDLCMGSRFRGVIHPGAMPWKNRYIGNPTLTALLNLFFRTRCSDVYCGLRAFTRQAYDRMHQTSAGMEFATEMVVKAGLLGLRVTEIPISLRKDARGRPPHLNPWRDGWRTLKFLLLYSPLWLFFVPAALSVLSGCAILTALLSVPSGQEFRFGPFWMGDHWLVIGTSAITIGYYLGILGVAALAYHANQTFVPQPPWVRRLTRFVTVENMCLIGGGLCLVGLAILGYVVVIWVSTLAQGLSMVRVMALGAMLVTMGILTFFSGFLFVFFSESAISPPKRP